MNKEVTFFGFKFTQWQFFFFFIGWMLFLGFVWPLIIGSPLFMSILLCGLVLILVGLFNLLIGLLLLVLFVINKSLLRIYQNFMFVIGTVFATWIYSLLVPMNFYIYIAHLAINIFSVFLMHMMFVKKGAQSAEDELITFDGLEE